MPHFDALTKDDMERALQRVEHLAVYKDTPPRVADDLGIVVGLAREELKRLFPTPPSTEG